MPEQTEIMFTHKELLELMLKKQNIHEGIWMISVKFGMQATNFGVAPDGSDVLPTAMIPIISIGLHRGDKVTNVSVDASVVNPLTSEARNRIKHKPRH
jgi:hypothetical protein